MNHSTVQEICRGAMLAAAIAAIAIVALSATGCATTTEQAAQKHIQETSGKTDRLVKKVNDALKKSRQLVRSENGYYVSPEKRPLKTPLPERFDEQVVLNQASPMTVTTAAKKISEVSGYKIVVHNDVFDFLKENSDVVSDNSDSSVGISTVNQQNGSHVGQDVAQIRLNYRGNLSGLLDRFASAASAYWEFNKTTQTVDVFRRKSEAFHIAAIPGIMKNKNSVLGSSSDDEGSSQSLSAESSAEFKVFESLTEAMETMVTGGGKYAVSSDMTTVTVTATPPVLRTVKKFIKRFNREMTKEVVTNVVVLSVNLSDKSQYGLNLDALYDGVKSSFAFNTARTATGFGTLTGTIVKDNSHLKGTSMIIDALSKQGDVSVVTKTTLRTLNNQSVPFHVGKTINYIANNTVAMNDNITTTGTEVKTLNVGLSLGLTPHIRLHSKNILMEMTMSMSSLLDMKTINIGNDQVVQTPTTSQRNTLERFQVESGKLLVITGFERNTDSSDSKRPLPVEWAFNLFGGERKASQEKEVLVILMRPTVVDGSQS